MPSPDDRVARLAKAGGAAGLARHPPPRRQPYWWEAAPPPSLPEEPVPPAADIAIMGAGYTGLSAAITLARAGRSVHVFDRMRAGEGASTRNGGITSGHLRPSLAEMTRAFGAERALSILAEAKAAREDLYRFIADENIDCDFALTGRFTGASAPGDYEGLAREADALRARFGIEANAVPRAEQKSFLGTDFYHGGAVRPDIGGLDPAKLLAGMLAIARAAGAVIHTETAIRGMRREGMAFEVMTARGNVVARDVLIATNGYTDAADPWLRRRLVPVRSRIIATAPISPNLMGELMPKRMMCSETRALSYYFRPSPDGTRILFGGRDGTIAGDPDWPSEHLRRVLAGLFPALSETPITHSWFGYVAMNRDNVPRIFARDGVRYACGYCGSGVVWARWAGQKAAWQILGNPHGASSLDFRAPASVPFFNGTAWFMPVVYGWLGLKDRLAKRTVKPPVPGG